MGKAVPQAPLPDAVQLLNIETAQAQQRIFGALKQANSAVKELQQVRQLPRGLQHALQHKQCSPSLRTARLTLPKPAPGETC
jgi:hypothetical protein